VAILALMISPRHPRYRNRGGPRREAGKVDPTARVLASLAARQEVGPGRTGARVTAEISAHNFERFEPIYAHRLTLLRSKPTTWVRRSRRSDQSSWIFAIRRTASSMSSPCCSTSWR